MSRKRTVLALEQCMKVIKKKNKEDRVTELLINLLNFALQIRDRIETGLFTQFDLHRTRSATFVDIFEYTGAF